MVTDIGAKKLFETSFRSPEGRFNRPGRPGNIFSSTFLIKFQYMIRLGFLTSYCTGNMSADIKRLSVVIRDHFLHSSLLTKYNFVQNHQLPKDQPLAALQRTGRLMLMPAPVIFVLIFFSSEKYFLILNFKRTIAIEGTFLVDFMAGSFVNVTSFSSYLYVISLSTQNVSFIAF